MSDNLKPLSPPPTLARQTVLMATGASGGHLFPALAVAEVLHKRGYRCVFVVGGHKFTEQVRASGFDFVRLPAAPFNVRNPLRKLKAILYLFLAVWRAVRVTQKENPAAVFGTGGYATVATVLAAKLTGVPVVVHEQNVLPGRANKVLVKLAQRVALAFGTAQDYMRVKAKKVVVTGNPVRAEILQAFNKKKPKIDKLQVLVTGGSQGARVLNEVVPATVARLPEDLKARVTVVHQARLEDIAMVKSAYAAAGVGAEVIAFIEQMGEALMGSDVVISRAGAGAVVETSLFGRPAIYVPHPLADGHQKYNAQVVVDAGAAVLLMQEEFTPEAVLPHLKRLLEADDVRGTMGMAAQKLFPADAAEQVADVVVEVAKDDIMSLGGMSGEA